MAMMAVMKAGGCYVPIDHTLPAARVQSILEQAGCKLMLTQEGVEALASLPDIAKLMLTSEWEQFQMQPGSNPVGRCSISDPAYILFTSGKQLCSLR
jgi:iturin family lipopeptide synthetase A